MAETWHAARLYFLFPTAIHKGNPFFDHCLFNDRILSVRMRVHGSDLGTESVTVRLGWGDLGCQDIECGTTVMRSENAFSEPDFERDGVTYYLDDLRAYKIRPKLATLEAVVGNIPFPTGAENYDLATRSVANSNWTLMIDMTLPANQGFNLDNVDEIALIIEHEAYTLQAPICQAPPSLRLASARPYRPMETVLEPHSLTRSAVRAPLGDLSTGAGPAAPGGLYAGTVIVSSPAYMPTPHLGLVVTDTIRNTRPMAEIASRLRGAKTAPTANPSADQITDKKDQKILPSFGARGG